MKPLDTVWFGATSHSGGGGWPRESGFLHVEPRVFQNQGEGGSLHRYELVDERGKEWCLAGYAIHTLIASVARGQEVRPILDAARDYGANTILALGSHRSPWKFLKGYDYDPLRPDNAEIVARCFDLCADAGLRLYFKTFADMQAFGPEFGFPAVPAIPLDQQRALLDQNRAVMRGRWNAIDGLGNEDGANGWLYSDFDRPADSGGVLCSRGQRGIDEPSPGEAPLIPFKPYWDIGEYSSRRKNPENKSIIDAGCYELYHGGWDANPDGYNCVLINSEPPILNATNPDRNGDTGRWTDPNYVRILGATIGAHCSGGICHTTDGMECLPLDPQTEKLARVFLGALRGAFYEAR